MKKTIFICKGCRWTSGPESDADTMICEECGDLAQRFIRFNPSEQDKALSIAGAVKRADSLRLEDIFRAYETN